MNKYIIIFFIVLFFVYNVFAEEPNNTLKEEFEKRYQIWKKWVDDHSVVSDPTDNETFAKIIELGIPVLPYIIEKMENNFHDFPLEIAISLITWKRFKRSDWPPGKLGDAITASKMYIKWWRKERQNTPVKFEKLYKKWKSLKRQKKYKEAKEVFTQIEYMGIIAFPYIMKKVEKNNDVDLISIIEKLTKQITVVNLAKGILGKGKLAKGILKEKANRKECINWWKKNKKKWLIKIKD